jgi:hypothetical protein
VRVEVVGEGFLVPRLPGRTSRPWDWGGRGWGGWWQEASLPCCQVALEVKGRVEGADQPAGWWPGTPEGLLALE